MPPGLQWRPRKSAAMNDLKRCPCCGARAMIQRHESYYEDEDYNSIPVKKARVVCQVCLMRTEWDSEAVVVDVWNNRATTPKKGCI